MKRTISKLLRIALWLVPLLLIVIPLPIKPEFDSTQLRWLLLLSLEFILIACALLLKRIGHHQSTFPGPNTFYLLLAGSVGLSSSSLIFSLKLPSIIVLLLLLASVVSWLVFSARQTQIKAHGIVTLLLTLCACFSTELFFRQIPPRVYHPEVATTPALTRFVDKGNAIFQKNGFRGLRVCKDCPSDRIKIFTMGGSSVYGIPMYYTLSNYASVLQRILNERRPGENYEVLNAGIPGYGIVQVIDSLNQEILKYKPDIVTFGEWFNETAAAPGWYGIAGKSDMQGYVTVKILLWLQNFKPYAIIHNSKLFALSRFYLLAARDNLFRYVGPSKPARRPRMTPDEYRDGLYKFIKLAEQHNFLPVFILEPLNHTLDLKTAITRNEYQRTMYEVANEQGVPLVDPLTPMHNMPGAWLFYDIIHSNDATHRVIAEAIYDTLFFSKNPTQRVIKFAKNRALNLTLPEAKRAHSIQFARDELKNRSVELTARVPYLENDSALLRVTANEKEVGSFTNLSAQANLFKIKFGNLDGERPIIDLKISAHLSVEDEQKWLRIGQTGRSSPVYISAQSDAGSGGAKTKIFVREQRYDPKSRGYNVVVIGAKSGEVRSTGSFDTYGNPASAQLFTEYISTLSRFTEGGQPPIVAMAVGHDGRQNIEVDQFSSAFKSIGGSGNVPNPLEAFVLIGTLGATPGSAVEVRGESLVKTEIGSREILPLDLLEVQGIRVVD